MKLQIGDILSIPLAGHTKHYFVYVGEDTIVEWGPKDGVSWMVAEGQVWRRKIINKNSIWLLIDKNLNTQEIDDLKLESRTGATLEIITERINQMTQGIDYHLGHRNCEHFANYITGQTPRSIQSIWHLFTDHDPFTIEPNIRNIKQLKEALLRCKFCGNVACSKKDFENAVLVAELPENYYVYYLSHSAGGQHLYVTTVPKSKNLEQSYQSIIIAKYGAFLGRGEIMSIVRQLRGC